MRRKTVALPIIISILASLSVPIIFAQPPMPPCWFYGTASVDGLPAKDNISVAAKIRGTNLTWTTRTKNGTYGWTKRSSSSFYIPSDDPMTPEKDGGVEGDEIEFYINGVKTNQTATFENMILKRVDLAIESVPEDSAGSLLVVGVLGNGTTDPAPGSYVFVEDSNVSVHAYPDSGWLLSHWLLNGSDVVSDTPCNVTMNSDYILIAVFVEEPVHDGSITNLPLLYPALAMGIATVLVLALWIHRRGHRKPKES